MQRDSRVLTSKLDDVRAILREARGRAYAAVNTAMVQAYWQIGRRIVEEEQGGERRAGYGDALITGLARALGEEFGKGISVANLKNFKQFYMTFPDPQKSYAVRSFLTWTHWRLLMRVENPQAQEYYIEETARQQWSSRALERAITTHTPRPQNPCRTRRRWNPLAVGAVRNAPISLPRKVAASVHDRRSALDCTV